MGASSIDALWDELAPHLEWPEGLSLVLLFAGHPGPVGELKQRFEQSLRDRGRGLRVLDPQSAGEIEALVANLLATLDADCGGLWVSLLRQAGAPGWSEAVKGLLQRLNERRFLLERDVGVPLVLVLPLEIRSEFHWLAPDLWTVRSFAERVPGPKVAPKARGPEKKQAEPQVVGTPGRAEVEWARLLAEGDRLGIVVADGFLAFYSAIERGDLQASRRIAMETLAVALTRLDVEVEDMRNFDVTEALMNVDMKGGSAGRDLALALDKLGGVEMEVGNLGVARELFQRSLELGEAQIRIDPDSIEAQRDLVISVQNLGKIELEVGNRDGARKLFHRSIKLGEAQVKADPDNTEARRDLSISHVGLGSVEVQADNLDAARDSLQRSLELSEVRAKKDPDGVEARRDLAVSLDRLGEIEFESGNLGKARELFQRSLGLVEALAKTNPQDIQARFDVAALDDDLARLAAKQGDRVGELMHLRRAKTILEEMDTHGQLEGFVDRDALLGDILRRLS